ncbi:hypothetical protein CS369_10355 [Candidatus Symbiopectobacterium sp. 'North America']|uniref:hypothetical protein n=1 Tax=Candidatus Symbiopectobacterium sp. 'North America' TaxID=2794574 RepID=UPI001D5310E8|nr:hypothetical protein [Candidatus Symbiopectobacterium sp. 'North America']MBG6245074.1 hypothetical protein [Candidatus Symbiopectobacterium sp. 'North America']
MLWLEQGLYLRIHELDNGPRPLPLQRGFSVGTAYRVLGCFNPSETSDAYYILANDRDEIWFICNRHVRVVALDASYKGVRYPLDLSLHH